MNDWEGVGTAEEENEGYKWMRGGTTERGNE